MRYKAGKRQDLPIVEKLDDLFLPDDPRRRLLGLVSDEPHKFYGRFEIPKKSGGTRIIEPPTPALRNWQRQFLDELYERVLLPRFVHGGVPGKSIFSHAKVHVGKMMVATLDINKFFPSVNEAHVLRSLEILGIVGHAAVSIVPMLMLRGSLPQGAPTSPLIANLAFADADCEFWRLCKTQRLDYGRYVDDIAISGDTEFPEYRGIFEGIIRRAGFTVAPDKVAFRRRNERQTVTGLVVNDKLRPSREFIDELNDFIRDCQEFGAQIIAASEGISVGKLKSILNGRIFHLCSSDSKRGKRFQGRMNSIKWKTRD